MNNKMMVASRLILLVILVTLPWVLTAAVNRYFGVTSDPGEADLRRAAAEPSVRFHTEDRPDTPCQGVKEREAR
jgi:hypothetical protein